MIVDRSAEDGSGNRACRGPRSDTTWWGVGIWRTGQERRVAGEERQHVALDHCSGH